MLISSRNIFDYDSMLTKKRQLDIREVRIRTKEKDLLSQALTQRSTEDDSGSRLIRAQRFFELGFEQGFARAQGGSEMPNVPGLFSIFAQSLIRGNVRAEGGPIEGGETYIVGEEGPELIVSDSDAVVIPNDMLGSLKKNVNTIGTRTIIQPIVQRQTQTVPVPVPQPTSTNINMPRPRVTRGNIGDLPNSIARLIK